ncbi:MAG TPA: hypothetical protein VJ890_00160 [Vineibacter sp.]|nr:hypothetical protein [Vineibacter sp.]
MPKFKVLSRADAFVDYVAEIEAETAEEAVGLAWSGAPGIVWEERGTVEFDARHMVALDDQGDEIESTARSDFA